MRKINYKIVKNLILGCTIGLIGLTGCGSISESSSERLRGTWGITHESENGISNSRKTTDKDYITLEFTETNVTTSFPNDTAIASTTDSYTISDNTISFSKEPKPITFSLNRTNTSLHFTESETTTEFTKL